MTATDLSRLLNPEIEGIEAYTPISPLDVLSARLGIAVEDLVKLDANENPYGPIPAVSQALAHYKHWHIYPDPEATELREALADFLSVDANSILPGHGADELLDYICRIFLRPGDAIVNTPPTFGMYSFDAKLQGARVLDATRSATYAIDSQAIAQLVRQENANQRPGCTKVVFLTSPNNPSGNWLADAQLRAVLELPVMVVLDEAYVEFADFPSRASWVAQHDNLIVLRTFSKAAGIAGLRLGYGIFPQWLMPTLWKFKQPYNVNIAAMVAGVTALSHAAEISDVVAKLKAQRERTYAMLASVPYLQAVPASQANFILCKVLGVQAKTLKLALEDYGILVRHYAKPGLDNCIRISIGRPQDTDALERALGKLAY
jgi:histidinol-phosphate aminotransferase